MNMTSYFLIPLTGQDTLKTKKMGKFVDSYISDNTKDVGTHIYLEYTRDTLNDLEREELISSQNFQTKYYVGDSEIFEYNISEKDYTDIILPFLDGKFSIIDRDYVAKYFPNDPNSALYKNRLILDKSTLIRKEWEDRLGVSLPDGAEVWSKPNIAHETLTKSFEALALEPLH